MIRGTKDREEINSASLPFAAGESVRMTKRRNVIVHIGTSADGYIGDGIPLIARRHRHVPLNLHSVERFEDGVVQLHYRL